MIGEAYIIKNIKLLNLIKKQTQDIKNIMDKKLKNGIQVRC